MQTGNLLGQPFSPYVNGQIKARQKVHGKQSERTLDEIKYLNSRNAWVKLASGVSLKQGRLDLLKGNPIVDKAIPGSNLAQNNILFNGLSSIDKTIDSGEHVEMLKAHAKKMGWKTPGQFYKYNMNQRAGIEGFQSNPAYGVGGTDFGYSPMPGIIDMDFKCLNRGSIKKATLNIKAHNKNQFDVIDILYLRLGYSVFLEWGYDKYIDNDGNLKNIQNTLIDREFFKSQYDDSDYSDWLPLIEKKRDDTFGNYDGIFGTISNFSWTFNDDGSYDIKVEIISLGDIIESLKVNLPPLGNVDSDYKKAEISRLSETHGISNEFFETYPNIVNQLDDWMNTPSNYLHTTHVLDFQRKYIGIVTQKELKNAQDSQLEIEKKIKGYYIENHPVEWAKQRLMGEKTGSESTGSDDSSNSDPFKDLITLEADIAVALLVPTEDWTNIEGKFKEEKKITYPNWGGENEEAKNKFNEIIIESLGEVTEDLSRAYKTYINQGVTATFFADLLGLDLNEFVGVDDIDKDKWKTKIYTRLIKDHNFAGRVIDDDEKQGEFQEQLGEELDKKGINRIFEYLFNIKYTLFNFSEEELKKISQSKIDQKEDQLKKTDELLRHKINKLRIRYFKKYLDKTYRILLNHKSKENHTNLGHPLNPYKGTTEESINRWNQNVGFPIYNKNDIELSFDAIRLKITPEPTSYFIRFGTFLSYLENLTIPKIGTKKPLITIDTDREKNICYAIDNMVSSDIRKVIISNRSFYNGGEEKIHTISGGINHFIQKEGKYLYGRIMDIYLNFNFIEELFETTDTNNSLSLYKALKSMCDVINECLGGVNNLEPVITDMNVIKIIDQTPIPGIKKIASKLGISHSPDDEAIFEVFGYSENKNKESTSNFVHNIGLTTEISKNYATMITIGATSNGSIPGAEATAFSKWNENIEDRFKNKVTDADAGGDTSLKKQNEKVIANYDSFIKSKTLISGLNEKEGTEWSINDDQIKINKQTISNFYNYAQAESSKGGSTESSIGFLPFNLKIDMDGLSGIKIYNKLKVNTKFLPSNYPETLEFIITAVDHKLSANTWVTSLDTIATATSKLKTDNKGGIIINTPKILQGSVPVSTSTTTSTTTTTNSNYAVLGETILTKPSGFKLSTNAFGGKRSKKTVTQIYLHHTAGHQRSDKGAGTVHTFNNRAIEGNYGSTHAVIDKNGHLETLIPWEYKAYGQGVTGAYKKYGFGYNTVGMSIEIMALGYFTKKTSDGKSWTRKGGVTIPLDEGVSGVDFNENPIKYKGYPVFQKYTTAQINGTIEWIKKWMNFFNIQWKFDQEAYNEMFPDNKSLSAKATSNTPGVYSHNSVNKGKSDVFPQLELIQAFKKSFPK